MGKPIRWSGLRGRKNDLCTTRPSGYWDVVHSLVDGLWRVYSPKGRQARGYIARNEARSEAERQIAAEEAK